MFSDLVLRHIHYKPKFTSLLDFVILQCFTHLHTSTSSCHTHANYFQTPPCQFYLLPSLMPCDDILVLSSLLYIFPNCYISLSARFDAPSHDSSYLIWTPRPLVRLQHASIIHDHTKRILGISALSYTSPRLLVTPALVRYLKIWISVYRSTDKRDHAVTFTTRIREVLGWNLGLNAHRYY